MKLKIGVDVHGVADIYPELFAELTQLLVTHGHEVHVITGSRITTAFRVGLEQLGLRWTHEFSITDYHESIGTEVVNDSKGDPHMPAKIWNPVKAWYCKENGIHMMLDDSPTYGRFFSKDILYARVNRPRRTKSSFNPRL
jgi:hypothetical protein